MPNLKKVRKTLSDPTGSKGFFDNFGSLFEKNDETKGEIIPNTNMRDGSQVKVSAKDAADLNSLLKSLDSPANRERFNAEVKNSAEQYKELLSFARRFRKK